ncbi:hypothetical protein J7E99_05850 [Streptomyces sp. ISL-44]|nr:hypothetical protein [Streptomyces sp. ISL-44]
MTRPVHEVREMVALLGEPPHGVDVADITLRAAAVGRSIEDVALLVTILGTESEEAREAGERAEPPGPPEPAEEPYEEEPYEPPYQELYDAPYAKPRGHTERHPHPGPQPAPEPARSGPPVLRHVLRWPVAFALLVSGALHLPEDMAALPSAAPVGFLPLPRHRAVRRLRGAARDPGHHGGVAGRSSHGRRRRRPARVRRRRGLRPPGRGGRRVPRLGGRRRGAQRGGWRRPRGPGAEEPPGELGLILR